MEKVSLEKPTLIFVAGATATGKTTLIKSIFPNINDCLFLELDAVRESFLKMPDKSDGTYDSRWYLLEGLRHSTSSDHYREHIALQSYYALLEIAANNIEAGLSVFIEGNYTSQIKIGYFEKVVNKFLKEKGLNADVKILFLHTDKKTIADRIRRRNALRDQDKLKSDEALRDYLDSQDILPKELEKLDHEKIDGTGEVKLNMKKALFYLTHLEHEKS